MVSGSVKKILCGILLWSTLTFSATLVDRVVASVNSEPILESDVKMGMLYYGTADRRQVLNKLVEDTLVYQFLTSRGMQVPPQLIEEALQEIAKANRTNLEGIAKELAKDGLTLEDLKRFLEREILATQGLMAFLGREVKISDVELQLEKLKSDNVRVVREVELLVVDKKDQEKLKRLFQPEKSLEEIARALGLKTERLRVIKGELVEVLDREVWRVSPGELVFAEDENHVYVARVLSQEEVVEGKSLEELRQELLGKKIQARRQELLERLRRNSFIKVFQ